MCSSDLSAHKRNLQQQKRRAAAEKVYFEQGYQAGLDDDSAINLEPVRASAGSLAAWHQGFSKGKKEREAHALKQVSKNLQGVAKLKRLAEDLLK